MSPRATRHGPAREVLRWVKEVEEILAVECGVYGHPYPNYSKHILDWSW